MQLKPLTDTPMPSQKYAIDGAILLKSVEENVQEMQLIQLLLQMNKMGEHVALTCYKYVRGEASSYTYYILDTIVNTKYIYNVVVLK